MHLSNLPHLIHDETFYSLAAHIRMANGFRSDVDACKVLFGQFDGALVADAPVDLNLFCDVTAHQYGGPDDVLKTTTLSPLFQHLGGVALTEGTPQEEANKRSCMQFGLASLSNGQAHIWRWCKKCCAVEKLEWGTTYWHLAHQSPGVYMCPVHNYPLNEINVPFRERQQHFFLPESEPSNAIDTEWPIIKSVAADLLRLTKLVMDISTDVPKQIQQHIFYATIVSALQERGLITKTGSIRRNRIAEEFKARFEGLAEFPDYSDWLSKAKLRSLVTSTLESSPSKEIVRNIMLIDWLFGSWALFREHYYWQAMFSEPGVNNAKERGVDASNGETLDSDQSFIERRNQHRDICLSFLKLAPNSTRTDFWRHNQRTSRWLMQHDQDWFDANLPAAKHAVITRRQMSLWI